MQSKCIFRHLWAWPRFRNHLFVTYLQTCHGHLSQEVRAHSWDDIDVCQHSWPPQTCASTQAISSLSDYPSCVSSLHNLTSEWCEVGTLFSSSSSWRSSLSVLPCPQTQSELPPIAFFSVSRAQPVFFALPLLIYVSLLPLNDAVPLLPFVCALPPLNVFFQPQLIVSSHSHWCLVSLWACRSAFSRHFAWTYQPECGSKNCCFDQSGGWF